MIIMRGEDFPNLMEQYLVTKYKMMTTEDEIKQAYDELLDEELTLLREFKSCYELEDEQGMQAYDDSLKDVYKFQQILMDNLSKLKEEE